ncbi:hypothetical protein DAPPUDRAFT_252648 [Daphnia pulex]|uniref:Uncharacterized protein n=1 Tax=Daphnia pulex TaxID=6669 RepID=E9H368_DAPPU|nr:hypothetical protein DAPPUDRAFT_252648 [Daphnia pulex]|eukprot:EFX73706.1 hypothetical protein DAPPUDRAFT_252648 [Daphnia pulex]
MLLRYLTRIALKFIKQARQGKRLWRQRLVKYFALDLDWILRDRGLSAVKKSRQRRVADQPGQIDRRETHNRTNLCTCRRQQSEPPKTVDRRYLALKWRTGPQ